MLLRDLGRATPLVVVFVSICMGILIFMKDLPFIIFCAVFLIMLFSRERLVHMILGILLGFLAVLSAPHTAVIADGEYQVQGRVEEAGFLRGSYRVVLDEVSIGQKPIRGRAMIRIIRNACDLPKGTLFDGPVLLRSSKALGNPGEFDFGKYLLSEGIMISGYVKDLNCIKVVTPIASSRIKDRVTSALSLYARPEAEILKAVLTGDRSGLVYSLRDNFSSLGVAHLMAISGLHMGMIFIIGYSLAFMVLRPAAIVFLRMDTPFIATMAGVAAVVLYTLFVGYSAPAVRSAIMAGSIAGSLILTRKPCLVESLALAGIIILLLLPYSLFSASFLLSFAAVLGIAGAYTLLEGSPKWFVFIVITVVSTAFTSPIVVYLFGFMSLVSIPANMVLVPLFSLIIMPLGIAGISSMTVSDFLSSHLISLSLDGIGLILKASDLFGSLEPIARPPVFWIMICYLGLIVALYAKPSTAKTILSTACAFLIFAIPVGYKMARNNEPLCFDFISVGQGDSTLVTRGPDAVLIDAGNSFSGSDAGRFIIGPHLLQRGITRLNLVVVTHSHPDHIGGMPFILKRFPVREIWTNVQNDWGTDFQSVTRIAKRKSIPLKNVGLGDASSLEGMEIQVLNPPHRIKDRTKDLDLNLHSIVLRISDHTMKGLFMADAGGLGEIRLCRLEQDISADVLRTAHHGSKNSCLNMFLDRVNSQAAVISVGARNLYRHPHHTVIERLQERGITIYRTDHDGNILITRKKNMLHVKSGTTGADTIIEDASTSSK